MRREYPDCRECKKSFKDDEGYVYCINCGCDIGADTDEGEICFLVMNHPGPHVFNPEDLDEPTTREITQALASIGRSAAREL